ncbi:MAG: nitrate- and nitrite sensing domain-containing protein [Flavobacteriales bacterium]|nr:MAG: nitrate- and nitrite sensing domain-containing protein [Flavobacteriales bacterium]
MKWRFADLPVRTKFLVTLAIPVVGMVLLIGKQMNSSLDRRDVYQYISGQARTIELLSNVIHELQKEYALCTGFLAGRPVNEPRLGLQFVKTDEAINALQAADESGKSKTAFDGLAVLRQRVVDRRTTSPQVGQSYRRINNNLLNELTATAKLALDPVTKDRLYAHMNLLHAKEAMSVVRSKVGRGLVGEPLLAADMSTISLQLANFRSNLQLFERDAPAEVLATYRSTYSGDTIAFLNTVTGLLMERRSVDQLPVDNERWWLISSAAMDKLKKVEDRSIQGIITASEENLSDAEVRLSLVFFALIGTVAAVLVMALVIMRGIRRTVTEVSNAAHALAEGDVSGKVVVRTNDEIGEMADSFNGMIDNVRSLASSAEAIGRGNYDTTVPIRGEKDVLGLSLARMKENLKAARIRDMEQTRALQSEKEKLEQANERINTLIKEIHHRVKNNLQVVASLLRLQSAGMDDERLQHAFELSQSRVSSMALIHEKLYKGDDLARLDVARYLDELFAELVRVNDVRESITYGAIIEPGLELDLNTMVPLGLIVNELITNSFKHAFKGRQQGRVDLVLSSVGPNTYDLRYSDDGVGMENQQQPNEDSSLGMGLVESLTEQLNGFVTVDSGTRGTNYHIRFTAVG